MNFGNIDSDLRRKLKHIFVVIALLLPCTGVFAQYDKDVFFFRGRRALADGKYSQAIENFNVLSRIDTTDYWTFFYRVNAFPGSSFSTRSKSAIAAL